MGTQTRKTFTCDGIGCDVVETIDDSQKVPARSIFETGVQLGQIYDGGHVLAKATLCHKCYTKLRAAIEGAIKTTIRAH